MVMWIHHLKLSVRDNEVHDGMPECPQVSHAEIKYDMDQVRVIMPDACVFSHR